MKFLIAIGLFACVAYVNSHYAHSYASVHRVIHGGHGDGGHGGDGGYGGYGGHGHDYYAHPEYKYEYGVSDEHTGDHKNAWEHRDGGHTENAYKVDIPHPAVYGGGHGGDGGYGYGGHGYGDHSGYGYGHGHGY